MGDPSRDAAVTAGLSSTTVAVPGDSTLSLMSATPGTYSVTITASGGSGGTSRTHSVVIVFTVSDDFHRLWV
jgi:uncharacterized membrane protein